MDNQESTKMPKPFDTDTDLTASAADNSRQQFELQEEDGFKQEDYRQGNICEKHQTIYFDNLIFI